jgi:3-dehydroquinate dehydratase type I
MKIPYCLPIQKNTKAKVLRAISDNLSEYRFFEVWLDRVVDHDDVFVLRLKNLLHGRLAIVSRNADIRHFVSLLKNSPVLVDLDVASQAPAFNVKVIASYHNYKKTPDDKALRRIVARMDRYKPAVYKIATYCNNHGDALRLLQLLLELKKLKKKCIVVGMGPHGVIARIYGALWGNELVFTSKTKAESSAPGQLTKTQMEKIIRNLKNKN